MEASVRENSAVLPQPYDSDPKRFGKVALVHDYLMQDGGAERVLGELQKMFPDAPTYTLLYDRDHAQARNRQIIPSIMDRWPGARRFYQWYMPLMPMAVEHMDFSGYDLVISSSSSFAKGIIVPPETRHVCYCHTPTRFLWQERIGYINDLRQPRFLRLMLPPLLHRLRLWDRLAAERPSHLLTNSATSRERIRRYYNRDAHVIFPPVEISRVQVGTAPGKFWLAGGRLVGYKRFDLVVKAFAKLRLPLKIFGVGPEYRKLKSLAAPETEFLGYVTDEKKKELYTQAIGYLYPQIEDFGITAVEAMAAGRPVIAYGKGGGAETVIDGVTGKHIQGQAWEDIADAVVRFKAEDYDGSKIRRRAEEFSEENFRQQFLRYLDFVT
ncbi:MAG: glycosyltransferase [Patescibacteria group bacterium]|nr:glycosyltransferase [Patescibacteria group bacterium]